MSVSEKDIYQLTISINKALNGLEAPLKTKHARTAIIITHKTKESASFWMVVTRQPLMENRFTAWKFCHLLHKVLREGHKSIIKESQSHKKMIIEMGKLWGHLQDGVGTCIQAYSKLLVTKLSFHDKNALFCGSLIIDFSDIVRFADKDINVYFQLCVEIFDYLDDIIALQSQIFSSVNAYRMSSMTQQGQCRLAPLITLIQDSNALYDICVRLMFRLHDELPNDILGGHRDRFKDVFFKLKYFFDNARPLQYFANLIQVPHLPEFPPNFTSKVDFNSYEPPVVFVQPEQSVELVQPEQSVELVDTTEMQNELKVAFEQKMSVLESRLHEKDAIMIQMQNELSYSKQNQSEMHDFYKREVQKLQENNAALNDELASTKEICANMRMVKEELELQLANTPILKQEVSEVEEKAKLSQEKFTKLKTMYTHIRDEHINLLRQQSESVKMLNQERKSNSDLNNDIKTINSRIHEYEHQVNVLSEKNSDLLLKIADHETKWQDLVNLKDSLKIQVDQTAAKSEADNDRFNSKIIALEMEILDLRKLNLKSKDLEEKLKTADETIKSQNEKISQIIENNNQEIEEKNNKLLEFEKAQTYKLNNLQIQNSEISNSLDQSQSQLEEMKNANNNLKDEIKLIQTTNSSIEEKCINLESQLNDSLRENHNLKEIISQLKLKLTENSQRFYECFITSAESICLAKLDHFTQSPIEEISQIIEEMTILIEGLNMEYKSKFAIDEQLLSDDFMKQLMMLGYFYTRLFDQCDLNNKSTTEIEKGQEIFNKTRSINEPIMKLFNLVRQKENDEKFNQCATLVTTQLTELNSLIKEFSKTFVTTVDLDELVQTELKEMDLAIEEAANKIMDLLSNAREKNNGIKLEVNERILDACTKLMKCIQILIQKSRLLQKEIVSCQQGKASVKEFYKRNSQWSEGLISASKRVAKAANFLVDAANSAVTNDSGNNFELIVAAQEIAACTAQLVVASKVKAPKDSHNLVELTTASRSVSKATGAVVASVKDGNQHLEESLNMDLQKQTPSQIKTMEMEIQVKVLELEQALYLQRLKLTSFRKKHYQNTDY